MTKHKQFAPPSPEEWDRRVAAITPEQWKQAALDYQAEQERTRPRDKHGNPVVVVYPLDE